MAFKSKVTANIGMTGSASTLTPPLAAGETITIIGFSIANTSNQTITVTSQLIKYSGTVGVYTSATLIKNAEIPAGNTLIIVGGEQKLVLEQLDSIQASSSNATSADAIISYLI